MMGSIQFDGEHPMLELETSAGDRARRRRRSASPFTVQQIEKIEERENR